MSDKPAPLMDVNAIEAILPHRYPFLLVDRVLSMEPMKTLVAVKCVTVNEPFFAGHFPGHPVMPGVLILEALAQASALLAKGSMLRGAAATRSPTSWASTTPASAGRWSRATGSSCTSRW